MTQTFFKQLLRLIHLANEKISPTMCYEIFTLVKEIENFIVFSLIKRKNNNYSHYKTIHFLNFNFDNNLIIQ